MEKLRRSDRSMIKSEIDQLLRTAKIGHLGVCLNNQPYIVPLNFAYENNHIYFHCADSGQKIQFLRNNPSVCFEVAECNATTTGLTLCDSDTAYRSVVAFGTARIVTNLEEKTTALRSIVAKYMGDERARDLGSRTVDKYRSSQGSATTVVKITIEHMTGKHNVINEQKE